MIIRTLLLFVSLLIPVSASAADIQVIPAEGGYSYIIVEGEIVEGDAEKFRRIATQTPKAVVMLASPGGSLGQALEIGKVIQISGYSTGVMDDFVCASACALIWLAGEERKAGERAKIGFHASYRMDSGNAVEDGMANAFIGRYLTHLNLPSRAVFFITSASPTEMMWLDTSDPGSEGIQYTVIASDPEANQPPVAAQSSSSRARGIIRPIATGDEFANWMISLEQHGAMTSRLNGEGFLAFGCPVNKRCYFLVDVGMDCKPKDPYRLTYEVDGYARETVDAICLENGKGLALRNTNSFDYNITDETFIIFWVESDRGSSDNMVYSLSGYTEAVRALIQAGYISNGMGSEPD